MLLVCFVLVQHEFSDWMNIKALLQEIYYMPYNKLYAIYACYKLYDTAYLITFLLFIEFMHPL